MCMDELPIGIAGPATDILCGGTCIDGASGPTPKAQRCGGETGGFDCGTPIEGPDIPQWNPHGTMPYWA